MFSSLSFFNLFGLLTIVITLLMKRGAECSPRIQSDPLTDTKGDNFGTSNVDSLHKHPFKRATSSCNSNWPTQGETVSLSEAQTVNGSFDCGNKLYKSSGNAVFKMTSGGTLSNCFFAQSGGDGASDTIHIDGPGTYTISNCYFTDTGDDGISVKGSANVNVKDVYFMKASNKAIQHNGSGTVTISGGCYEDVHILAKSCGNCVENANIDGRTINVKDVTIINTITVCGVNTNKKDVCTVTGLIGTPTESTCTGYEGISDPSTQPTQTSKNVANANCVF